MSGRFAADSKSADLKECIILETAVEPPNTQMNADKTKHYIKKQTNLLGLTNIFPKPLISLRVSAFIGG